MTGPAPDLNTYVTQMLPESVRNMLTSGTVMTKYHQNGGSKKRTVRVALDWQTLVWSDPKPANKDDDDTRTMPFRFVKLITAGACTPALLKKPWLGKAATPDCSFAVFDTRAPNWSLSLEATTQKEAQDWVHGLQLLRDAYLNFNVGL